MQFNHPRGLNLGGKLMVHGVSLAPGETLTVDENLVVTKMTVDALAGVDLIQDEVGPLFHEYELWIGPGQSNTAGDSNSYVIDEFGEDSPDTRAFAVIRTDAIATAVNIATHWVPFGAAGDLQVARHPFQDSRSKTICPKLQFMKRRLELFPGIKQIAWLPVAKGSTGFYNTPPENTDATDVQWLPPDFPNPGDPGTDLFNDSFGYAEAFLAKHPRFRLAGTVSELGASEAPGTTQAAYTAALTAFLARWRTLRGGDEAVHVHYSMPAPYRAGDATLEGIHEAQQAFCAATPRCVFANVDDLLPIQGTPHYTPENYRILGRRLADASAKVVRAYRDRAAGWVRMQYDATLGRYKDVFGSGVSINAEVLATDGVRGQVLHADRQGFITDIQMPRDEYTFAMWCRRQANPSAGASNDQNEVFFGGKNASQGFGLALARTIAAHAENSALPADLGQAQFNLGLPAWDDGQTFENQPNPLLSSNWFHLAWTFKNGTFAVYRNGAAVAAGTYTSGAFNGLAKDGRGVYPAPSGLYTVMIGTWGPTVTQVPTCDMYFDDIVVLPAALSAAQIATLHSSGRLPI